MKQLDEAIALKNWSVENIDLKSNIKILSPLILHTNPFVIATNDVKSNWI